MGIVINRVYTRTGDAGMTRLAGSQEIEKDALRLEAYGTVDELNALIGQAVTHLGGRDDSSIRDRLVRIQNELFDLGGELATLPEDRHEEQILIQDDSVARLEAEIDEANQGLPSLRSFVLPGGGPLAAILHVARTIARRAERRVVSLHRSEPDRGEPLRYLNRLSDWLFVMSRLANQLEEQEELLWKRPDPSA